MLFADRAPHQVQTILGSCVSVCLYDTQLKFGGINHYMMPWWNGKDMASPKYGDIAIDLLLEKMISLGSIKQNLVAKVFGGANQHVFQNRFDVGARNVSLAKDMLKTHSISITGESVGGDRGRKIIYHTESGHVYMKFLGRIDSGTDDESH